jgi:hypothetical protein
MCVLLFLIFACCGFELPAAWLASAAALLLPPAYSSSASVFPAGGNFADIGMFMLLITADAAHNLGWPFFGSGSLRTLGIVGLKRAMERRRCALVVI